LLCYRVSLRFSEGRQGRLVLDEHKVSTRLGVKTCSRFFAQLCRYPREHLLRGGEFVGDLSGDDVRRGQTVGVGEALVFDPEEIEALSVLHARCDLRHDDIT